MRAKLKIEEIKRMEWGEQLVLSAICGTGEENTFSKATPAARLEMTITNPELFGKFNPGEKFYVDFTKAEGVQA